MQTLSQPITLLIESTREVFEMMVQRELTFGVPIEGEALRPKSNVVGTVSFAGSESGVVVFYCTLDAANEIAGALLGMPAADVNGEMPDAIGEMSNMIAGAFRTKMSDAGHPWVISIPTVTVGSDFYTKYVSDVRRVLCPFKMGEREVFVELILMKR
ncbi:MAG: chemotaxis protein CheX [Vicinamibacterales bacterium]|nr:chemotaxis protein CheX [Vicinamibacterales bacterium]